MWPFNLQLRNGLYIIHDTLLKPSLGSKHFFPGVSMNITQKKLKLNTNLFIFF